jgi:hypothetical protein
MLAVATVGLLVGLALPIVMVIAAVSFDVVALLWIAATSLHDKWSQTVTGSKNARWQLFRGHALHWYRHAHR